MSGGLGIPLINFSPLAQLGEDIALKRQQAEAQKLYGQQLDTALAAQGQSPLSSLGGGARQGQGLGALGQTAAPKLPSFASTGGDIGDYLSQTRARESGGNDLAANPNSTAKGRYQFTDSTWAGVAKRHPDLGLTPGGWRDPAQQERAMAAFTGDNAKALTSAGLPINPANLYGSHFLGEAGGPRFILGAINNPDAPATQFVTPGAASANRSVFYNKDGSPKTAGQVYAWLGGAKGRPSPSAAMPQQQATQVASADDADMPAQGAIPTEFQIPAGRSGDFTPGTVASPGLAQPRADAGTGWGLAPAAAQRISPAQAQNLRAMLANPLTQAHAAKIIEGLNRPDDYSFQVVGDQLVRTSKSGRAEVVPNITKGPNFSVVKGSDGNDYVLDPRTGQMTRALEGKPTQYTDILTPQDRAAAGVPAGYEGTVQRGPDGAIHYPGKPATSVNIDQKGETAFAQTANTGIAKRFQAISEEGDGARTDIALLGQLRALGGDAGTGGLAAIQGYLADKGIKLGDNVGSVEAYGALIDKLTPAQRIPGTGATSDFDARMFKGSLPRLINTPEGNELIVSTLEALARDKQARAVIAEKGLTGELKPGEAIKQLRDLPSPNLVFKSGLRDLQKNGKIGGSPASNGATGRPPPDSLRRQAADAIAQGADREKVLGRLREKGFDPSGL